MTMNVGNVSSIRTKGDLGGHVSVPVPTRIEKVDRFHYQADIKRAEYYMPGGAYLPQAPREKQGWWWSSMRRAAPR